MAKFKERKQGGSSVTASELSQMGVCERLVVFEHRHGKRWSGPTAMLPVHWFWSS
jgi:hypothetical protein